MIVGQSHYEERSRDLARKGNSSENLDIETSVQEKEEYLSLLSLLSRLMLAKLDRDVCLEYLSFGQDILFFLYFSLVIEECND
jgi:hypothetical protein